MYYFVFVTPVMHQSIESPGGGGGRDGAGIVHRPSAHFFKGALMHQSIESPGGGGGGGGGG